MRNATGSTRRALAPFLAGLVLGALMIAPASAHFSQNTEHLGNHAWKETIRERVFTKKQANQRFARTVASGTESQLLELAAGSCKGWLLENLDWKPDDAVVVTLRTGGNLVAIGEKLDETLGKWIAVQLCNVGGANFNSTLTLDWKVLRG